MKYIVLSPVGVSRSKHLEDWVDSVKMLVPQPEEIVICVDIDSTFDIPEGVTVLKSPVTDYYKGHLERICSGREILRRYYIKKDIPFSLWIDSDIVVPPETPKVLYDVWESKNVYVVVNKYAGRNDRLWCGSGVMFMERNACLLSRFWVSYIFDKEGNEKHLSEDFIFFAIFDQGKNMVKKWTGKSGRVCEEFVKVEHLSILPKTLFNDRTSISKYRRSKGGNTK